MDTSQFRGLRLAVAVAALGGLAACTIPLRGEEDAQAPSQAVPKSDALEGLTRCRTVIPEQKDAFEQCRQVWAENRRRFFNQDRSRTIATGAVSMRSSTPRSPASAP
jgi:conjugative transfer region protein TrbK